MSEIIALSAELIHAWRLEGATLIANTPTSHVFRADRDGESVIVKAFKPNGEDELQGIEYLQWRAGAGAVKVHDVRDMACLMEDAGGKTLTDLHNEKGDDAANAVLAKVTPALLKPSTNPYPENLPDLRTYFDDLFVMTSRHAGTALSAPLRSAAQTAKTLLDAPVEIQPLHGDIHHSNLITPDGKEWLAIDPKGILGDRHYDVANLFGNPRGNPKIILNAMRASRLADMLSGVLDLDRLRMLKFALAHSGLSVAWSLKNTGAVDEFAQERLDLIPILKSVIGDAAG